MDPGSPTVQLVDYLRAIRRRWLLIVLFVVLVAGTALARDLSTDKQYDATSQLLFRSTDPAEGLSGASSGSADPEREANTDVELIKLGSIAESVRRRLGLAVSTAQLLEQVRTETGSNSDIVSVIARDRDPERAAAIANAFVAAYVDFRVRSSRASLIQAAELAARQLEALSPEDRAAAEGRALEARRRELEIAAALQTGRVQIVQRAATPSEPAVPRPRLTLALGAIVGLLAGLVLAFALEFADRRIREERQVEEIFELPIIGAIPPGPRRRDDDSVQREAFSLLAANLRAASARTSRVVMITSPQPSDGKTSVTLGVARAFARLGLRVIAIEADLRRPGFGNYITTQPSVGLTGLLAGYGTLGKELTWLDANTFEPMTLDSSRDQLALAVLPAGELPQNPQHLLSGAAMAEVVQEARAHADVVLIDTPPTAAFSDAVTLARLVDSVTIVARIDKTTKDAARRAMRVLRGVDVGFDGVVVTDVRVEAHQYGYYQAGPAAQPRSQQQVSHD